MRFFKLLLVAGIMALSCVQLNAQGYVGGNASISFSDGDSGGTQSRGVGLTLAPNVAWYVSPKWAVGIRPTFSYTESLTNILTDAGVSKHQISIGLQPYARYLVWSVSRFGLWAECHANLDFVQKQPIIRYEYGLVLKPILSFDINEHLMIETAVNLLSFSIGGYYQNNNGTPLNNFYASLGCSPEEMISSLSNFSIGVFYKF